MHGPWQDTMKPSVCCSLRPASQWSRSSWYSYSATFQWHLITLYHWRVAFKFQPIWEENTQKLKLPKLQTNATMNLRSYIMNHCSVTSCYMHGPWQDTMKPLVCYLLAQAHQQRSRSSRYIILVLFHCIKILTNLRKVWPNIEVDKITCDCYHEPQVVYNESL